MIDFKNANYFKLKAVDNSTYASLISATFADGKVFYLLLKESVTVLFSPIRELLQ